MNFFLQIHRSIFDQAFYREAPSLGRRAVFLFVIKLVLIASGISALAHTCYVFSASRGTAGAIAAAMKGIEIKDGRLKSDRPLPYEIPARDLNLIYSRFITIPATIDTQQTPRFIVDTSANAPARTVPSIIMRSTDVAFYPATGAPQLVPYYKKSWYGPANLQFTESGTRAILKKAVVWIFLINLLWDGLCCAALVLFCICMLGLAAYIFRVERGRNSAYFFRIAGFAITPIPIGMVIIALSDVNIPGSWHFLVVLSVVVMFRALTVGMRDRKRCGFRRREVSFLNVVQKKGDEANLDGRITVYAAVDIDPEDLLSMKHSFASMVHNGFLVAQGNFRDQYNFRDFLKSEMGISLEDGLGEGLSQLIERMDGLESTLDPQKLKERLENMDDIEDFIPTPAKIVPFHSEEEILAQEGDVFFVGTPTGMSAARCFPRAGAAHALPGALSRA